MTGDARAALAEEHARHIALYNTQYDGKGGIAHEDHGGLWCSCGEWDSGPVETYRPWSEWHTHVVEALLAALPAAASEGPERSWQDETAAHLLESARQIVAQIEGGDCSCPDSEHQNRLHDLAQDVTRVLDPATPLAASEGSDDRETLAKVLRETDDAALVRTNFGQICATYDEHADAILAAGFRRPVTAGLTGAIEAMLADPDDVQEWPVFDHAGEEVGVAQTPVIKADRLRAALDAAVPEDEATRWRRRALFAEEAIQRAMRLYHEAVRQGLTLQPTAIRDALSPRTVSPAAEWAEVAPGGETDG